jgi:hypothetical protein
MPAHVTLVYPFLRASRLDDAETRLALADLFKATPPLRFALARAARFPGVLYLVPEPAQPIIDLIERLVARFPEAPPYEGRFADIVPHLTVAHADDPAVLARIEDALRPSLPLVVESDHATLCFEEDGYWHPRAIYRFEGA